LTPPSEPGLFGAGRGNCCNTAADTLLKQLVGILFPGHCFPAAACGEPKPGIVQPAGISDGVDAHAIGTKICVGKPMPGSTRALKSPPSSAAVGTVTGLGAKDCLYLS